MELTYNYVNTQCDVRIVNIMCAKISCSQNMCNAGLVPNTGVHCDKRCQIFGVPIPIGLRNGYFICVVEAKCWRTMWMLDVN